MGTALEKNNGVATTRALQCSVVNWRKELTFLLSPERRAVERETN